MKAIHRLFALAAALVCQATAAQPAPEVEPRGFRVEVLREDAETEETGWTAQAPWAITDELAASPTHSWTDSPGGDYDDSTNAALISPPLDLGGLIEIELEFFHRVDVEAGFDFALIEISTDDGATWSEAASYSVEGQTELSPVLLALPALAAAAQARIRFRLVSDDILSYDGWHLDDIVVTGLDLAAIMIFRDDFESGDTSAWSTTVP